MNRSSFYILIIFFVFISGCATAPPTTLPSAYRTGVSGRLPVEGVYHKVKKGETLWRISKNYDVDLERIVTANRLADITKIEVGQKIFIPGVKSKKDIFGSEATLISKPDFIWPVKGRVISYFGAQKDGIINKGIDIQAKSGTKVLAARSGKITFIDQNLKGYGKTIIIDHQDGYSTVYTNNAEILVKLGQAITQNMPIATVGTSGRAATASLHFEIRKRYKAQNPFYYLP